MIGRHRLAGRSRGPLSAHAPRLALLLLALGVALAALAAPARAQGPSVTMTGSHNLDADHYDATAIGGDGTTLWIASPDNKSVEAYKLSDLTVDTTKSFDTHTNNGVPTGIAYDSAGSRVLVLDSDYALDVGGTNRRCYFAYSTGTITGGGTSGCDDQALSSAEPQHPLGFTAWGKNAWFVDSDDTKAYAAEIADDGSPLVQDIDFHADNADPWGAWTDGRTLWVVDTADTFVYAYSLHDGARDTDREFDLDAANDEPRGIWSDGTTMYVVDLNDTAASKLYKYSIGHLVDRAEADDTFDIVATAATPRGIAVSSNRIYIADTDTDKIYVYDQSATPVRQTGEEFDLPAANQDNIGIWTDGTHLWVIKGGDTTVRAYLLSSKSAVSAQNLTLGTGNDKPVSLWANRDGTTWWVVDRADDKVYGYLNGTHTASLDFNLHEHNNDGNDSPFGGWSDGVTAWVVDANDDYIYAYWLSGPNKGERRPEKEIRLDPGNVSPEGLSSDGDNLFVLERGKQTVYLYDINTAPRLARDLEDQVALSEVSFEYQFPANAFRSLDGDALTYTAGLSNGSPLPSWLTFTAATRTFESSRVPKSVDGDTFTIRVSASDGVDTVSDDFDIYVNQRPVVAIPIPDQEVALNTALSYTLAAGTFTDPENDPLSYSASRRHRRLPSWLSFNDSTLTFSGTTPNSPELVDVSVSVSDGNGSMSDLFFIAVGNVPPQFPAPRKTLRVLENTAAGENIEDPLVAVDYNSADTVTYSLGGTDAAHFDIVATSGQLQTKGALDFEGKKLYTVIVTATDDATPPNTDTLRVNIEVTNVNEPATISGPATRSYAENGTGPVGTYTVSDPEGQTITLLVGGVDSTLFFLSGSALGFVSAPDFEDPKDDGKNNVYNVTILGTDGPHTISYPVVITVTNVVEGPSIDGDAAVDVEEGSTAVGSYTVVDPDGGTFTWSALSGTDAGHFTFVSSTGALSFTTAPDFESAADDGENNVYEVTLTATESSRTVTLDVAVTVTNKDEEGTVTLSSKQPQVGTALRATLSDPDGATSSVTWTWQTVDSGTVSDIAGGHTYTPVSLDVGLTLRAVASYTDPLGSGKSAQADSANAVRTAPRVNTAPSFPNTETGARSVAENTTAGQNIGAPVAATDSDTDDTLTYTLGGTDKDHFDIVSGSGQLQTKSALDHENKSTYTVTVTATDVGNASATQSVTITVTDVNEEPTITGDATVSVTENSTTVGTYGSEDDDTGATFTWSALGGTDAGDFTFVSSTGVLSFTTAPDFENPSDDDPDNVYEVTLQGSDGTNTVTLDVTVTVTNVNEVPTITGDAAVIADEGATPWWYYSANDPENASITWTLAGTDRSHFSIDPNAEFLALQFSSAPDFEEALDADKDSVYELELRASDGTNTARLNITATVFNRDDTGTVTLSNEQPQAGTPITASLEDPDGSISDLQWQWQGPVGTDLSGNGADTATYTPQAGDVGNTLRAIATYTDGQGSGKSAHLDSANTVQAAPVGNRVPAFPNTETGARSVPENTAADQPIGTPVAATDPDSDALTYTLGGTDKDHFDIVSGSGQLRTKAALDHETKPTYNVTVTATDPSTLSVTQQVTITVTDEDEPPVLTGETQLSYPHGGTGVVATYRASDPEGEAITWTLGGADASAFTIDGGRLRFVAPPDSNAPGDNDGNNVFEVTVTATDPASQGVSLEVEVTVTERAAPPRITGGGGGGGGATGPTPSLLDFEWTVKHDLEPLDEGHGAPTGMWSDGTTLWIANNPEGAGDAAYAYALEGGERVEEREFALDQQNRAPRGIWSDGETVWLSDSGRDRLFAYRLQSGKRLEERDLALAERNGDVRGIWSDGTVMWALDDRGNAVFAYDLETGELLAEYALDSGNGSPQDIWSDGVGVWVSDPGSSPRSLFAYRLPTREQAVAAGEGASLERVRDEDFAHLSSASNNSPRGIWSDGDIMYVVDASDGKVYTYNMPDAIDARLTSLTLNGVDIGAFSPDRTEYESVIAGGVTKTVVRAEAMQRRTSVVIHPPDASAAAGKDEGGEEGEGLEGGNGHQVALTGLDELTVTVTSADGTRTRVYRVTFEPTVTELALGPTWTSFEWPGSDAVAVGEAGLPEEVVAIYTWDETALRWLGYFPGLDNVPGLNTLTAFSSGTTYWVVGAEPVRWTLSNGGEADAEAVVAAAPPE